MKYLFGFLLFLTGCTGVKDISPTASPAPTIVIPAQGGQDLPKSSSQSLELNQNDSANFIIQSDAGAQVNIRQTPTHGTLSGTAPNFTYNPSLNFNGIDSFTFTVEKDGVVSSEYSITLKVIHINQPPVAEDMAVDVWQGILASISVNLKDIDSSVVNLSIVTAPTQGSAVVMPDGKISYTAMGSYSGPDSLTYKLTDDQGAVSQIKTISLNVKKVNHSPVGADLTISNSQTTGSAYAILSVYDPDGDTIYYNFTNPLHGVLTGVAPIIEYIPNPSYTGTDSFQYTVKDPAGLSNTYTVSINVTAVVTGGSNGTGGSGTGTGTGTGSGSSGSTTLGLGDDFNNGGGITYAGTQGSVSAGDFQMNALITPNAYAIDFLNKQTGEIDLSIHSMFKQKSKIAATNKTYLLTDSKLLLINDDLSYSTLYDYKRDLVNQSQECNYLSSQPTSDNTLFLICGFSQKNSLTSMYDNSWRVYSVKDAKVILENQETINSTAAISLPSWQLTVEDSDKIASSGLIFSKSRKVISTTNSYAYTNTYNIMKVGSSVAEVKMAEDYLSGKIGIYRNAVLNGNTIFSSIPSSTTISYISGGSFQSVITSTYTAAVLLTEFTGFNSYFTPPSGCTSLQSLAIKEYVGINKRYPSNKMLFGISCAGTTNFASYSGLIVEYDSLTNTGRIITKIPGITGTGNPLAQVDYSASATNRTTGKTVFYYDEANDAYYFYSKYSMDSYTWKSYRVNAATKDAVSLTTTAQDFTNDLAGSPKVVDITEAGLLELIPAYFATISSNFASGPSLYNKSTGLFLQTPNSSGYFPQTVHNGVYFIVNTSGLPAAWYPNVQANSGAASFVFYGKNGQAMVRGSFQSLNYSADTVTSQSTPTTYGSPFYIDTL